MLAALHSFLNWLEWEEEEEDAETVGGEEEAGLRSANVWEALSDTILSMAWTITTGSSGVV